MDQRILLNRAISKLGGVAPGTEFLLKDLFDRVDWKSLNALTSEEHLKQKC